MCLGYVNWKESAKPLVHPHSDCSTAVGGDQPERSFPPDSSTTRSNEGKCSDMGFHVGWLYSKGLL